MIPEHIRKKAIAAAEKMAAGELRPRLLRLTRTPWRVVDLSKRWRFISHDGVTWRVVSHETYSKLTATHRNNNHA
jgi:hypothetical protein